MAAVILKASSIAFPVAYLFFAEITAEIIVEGVVVLYVVVAGADPCGILAMEAMARTAFSHWRSLP